MKTLSCDRNASTPLILQRRHRERSALVPRLQHSRSPLTSTRRGMPQYLRMMRIDSASDERLWIAPAARATTRTLLELSSGSRHCVKSR